MMRKGSAPVLGASAARLGSVGGWSLQQTPADSVGCLGSLAQRSRLQAEQRSARLTITIEAEFDIACWVSLDAGTLEGSDLPLVVSAGSSCSVSYTGDAEGVVGALVLEGFREGVAFQVKPATENLLGESFVIERGKQHAVVTERVADGSSSSALTLPRAVGARGAAGAAVELWMRGGCPSSLSVRVRRAQEAEVRCLEERREARREGRRGEACRSESH